MSSSANRALLLKVQQLKAEHPYWGCRRIWAYLEYHEKLPVNQKRIHRIMRQTNLLVPKNSNLKAPRKAVTHKPGTIEPNRYWGIDMTRVMIPVFGRIYLRVVVDWGTKKLLSTHTGLTNRSADWIAALNEAVNLQFPDGMNYPGAEHAGYPEFRLWRPGHFVPGPRPARCRCRRNDFPHCGKSFRNF